MNFILIKIHILYRTPYREQISSTYMGGYIYQWSCCSCAQSTFATTFTYMIWSKKASVDKESKNATCLPAGRNAKCKN